VYLSPFFLFSSSSPSPVRTRSSLTLHFHLHLLFFSSAARGIFYRVYYRLVQFSLCHLSFLLSFSLSIPRQVSKKQEAGSS
jgi:hypothetical protein